MPEDDQSSRSEVTEEAIGLFIGRFYAAIRRQPVLGPIFDSAISAEEWPEHLATMRRFWSSVMLASGQYAGNPVAIHRAVPNLERPMFALWIAVFEATARELFVPDVAVQFTTKAQRIAASLQLALFHKPGDLPEGLVVPPRKSTVRANSGAP